MAAITRFKKILRSATCFLCKAIVIALIATIVPVILLRWIPPVTSSFMIQKWITSLRSDSKECKIEYKWTPWEKISPHAGIAVVAAEDQVFPEHFGFDLESISDAIDKHSKGRRLRGASTISQQVSKNLFLWSGRSLVRKGFEAYFTVLIELIWPKRRILEVYLNIAEFGDGIYGVAAAGEAFFKKSPSKLTPSDAALLAAVLPNPIRLKADRPSSYVNSRRLWILDQMSQLGGISYLKNL
ncbi:MAG: monofunctional biosynthetic peptidoglycan transglycosylase [Desulfobacterales bacterium]